jgi:SAM-dependent methyltransferase
MRKYQLKAWNWAILEPEDREFWLSPSGDVFEFALHLKHRGHRKVYDLGCGLGRHLFFLLEMGFDVYGSDYSLDAVRDVNQRLEEMVYEHRVKHESMTEISEPDESCDAVIAYNVVYHAYLADMIKTLNNIHRILRPGGSLLITFQSITSPIYNKEEEVEPRTIVKKKEPEIGIPHHLVDQDEILKLLSGYHIEDLKYVEHEYDGMRGRGCHFVVTATKK